MCGKWTIGFTRESYKEKLRHLVHTNCHASVLNDPYFQDAMKCLPFEERELESVLLNKKTALVGTLAMLQVIEFVRY